MVAQREYKLGALQAPHNPAEAKYALRNRPIAKVTRITESVLLPDEFRVDVADQQNMGSCAAVSSERAASMARKAAGIRDAPTLHWSWLYFHARLRDNLIDLNSNTGNRDTGSHVVTNLDLLKEGAPELDTYIDDAYWVPSADLEQQQRHDYVLNYANFYPMSEGIESFWTAFQANMPVVISMYWRNEYFNPTGIGNCVLQEGLTIQPGMGAHAVTTHGGILYNDNGTPKRGIRAQNQWSQYWCQDAPQFGYGLRPGEFVIPENVVRSMIFSASAVSYEPFYAAPDPTPVLDCTDAVRAEYERALAYARQVDDGYAHQLRTARGWDKTIARYAKMGASAVVQHMSAMRDR